MTRRMFRNLGVVAALLMAPIRIGAAQSGAAVPAALSDLPLSLVEAHDGGSLLAVLLTGDGGLARAFAQRSVPVVALSSPAYLAHGRTPDQAARDLGRIIQYFLAAWHRQRVVVVGYSRGADIGPFMIGRLAAPLRERVALAALLGPGAFASFKAGAFDFLHSHTSSGLAVKPEIARLRGTTVLFIYGSNDRGAICPSLEQAGLARAVGRAGGHRVHAGEGPTLVNLILGALPRQQAGGSKPRQATEA